MSLRTKINGFTAWVNLRLTPYNQLLNNVLMDLLSGTHMKYFVESFTGRDLKKLENMDGLSDQQKQTRVDWMIEELKKCNVIPDDVTVDTRMFAMRNSEHVFDLLWRLISHDVWFVWERAEYLQVMDYDILTQVPFKWTPDPPPRKKKSKKQGKKSLLSGFGPPTSTADDRPDDAARMTPRIDCKTNISSGSADVAEELYSASDSDSDWSYEMKTNESKTDEKGVINWLSAVETPDFMSPVRQGSSIDIKDGDQTGTQTRDEHFQTAMYNKYHLKQDTRIETCNEQFFNEESYTKEGERSISRRNGKMPSYSNSNRLSELVSIYIVPLNDDDDERESRRRPYTSPGNISRLPWQHHSTEKCPRSRSETIQTLSPNASGTFAKFQDSRNLMRRSVFDNHKIENMGIAPEEYLEDDSVSWYDGRNSRFDAYSPGIAGSVQTLPARFNDAAGQRISDVESTWLTRNLSEPDLRIYKEQGEDISQALRRSFDTGLDRRDDDDKWVKFPNAEYMKGFKKKKKRDKEQQPGADECILEMINFQLKTTRDGKGLFCYSIDDFVDSRVLCALVNSFVPNTFTADLLLNDRWTINLALKTAEKMFYAETPFDAEDLVEADTMAVCAYFTFFLMCAYRYRQTVAVVDRVDFINMLIRESNHDLEKFPPIIANMQELQRRKDLKQQLDKHRQALETLQRKYDVEFCRKWVQHVEHVQNELRRDIRDKMRMRFEIVEVPRNITINDFCLAAVINLSLTNGSGFFNSPNKETLSDGRKLVLQNKETKEFIEDFTNRSKASIKDTLRIPDVPGQVLEINPDENSDFEFFFEAQSRNKQLRAGTYFLYQVFPGNTVTWQRLFIKSAREAEYETVEKMIAFFRDDTSFINCREPKSGNTALHWACRMGHFDVVRLLLENGANIDIKNNFRCSPLNLAIEALQRRICHYLIEWGCDVHCKNVKGQSALETIKNDEFKRYLMDIYEYYSSIVPPIMGGNMQLLDRVIADHVKGIREFCCLRSRCVNGSTLLHTACYYGHVPAIKELLAQRVDVNLRDYKGATPLHRAKNPDIMELLLEAGAHVNAEDSESNTPLHVKCYGETGMNSEAECIQLLFNKNASLVIRNSKYLLPIHCCAMQGRVDVMQQMMQHDKANSVAAALNKEDAKKPPSLLHLAIANDFIDCAQWLMSNGFSFKEKEPDILLRRILTEQIKLNKRAEAVKFLLENGADSNPKYPGGNTALHYSAGLSGPSDVLELLVSYKADVDVINDEGCTPLFFATQANNKFAACVLIEDGSNVRQKNSQGLTAFDFIVDFEEWIDCGYFSEEIKARLKAYNLKHARDLIRAITKKVKPPQLFRADVSRSHFGVQTPGINPQFRIPSSPVGSRLPPLHAASATSTKKYLMC